MASTTNIDTGMDMDMEGRKGAGGNRVINCH